MMLVPSVMARRHKELLTAERLPCAIINSGNCFSVATGANSVIQIFNVCAERMLASIRGYLVPKL